MCTVCAVQEEKHKGINLKMIFYVVVFCSSRSGGGGGIGGTRRGNFENRANFSHFFLRSFFRLGKFKAIDQVTFFSSMHAEGEKVCRKKMQFLTLIPGGYNTPERIPSLYL